MATISNPKVCSGEFLTVDDVKTLSETTHTSVILLVTLRAVLKYQVEVAYGKVVRLTIQMEKPRRYKVEPVVC